MIVKNEEAILGDCLRSIPPDLIDFYVICDTGSTDNTRNICYDQVGQRPSAFYFHGWENFGANKTKMLQEAAKSGCDWILMMDADHRLNLKGHTPELVKEFLSHRTEDQLMLRFPSDTMIYWLPQLIRNNRAWKYVGAAHEYLESDPPVPLSRERFYAFEIIDLANGSNRNEKFSRDAQLLEQSLKSDPGNARDLYYLAQTYRDMGDTTKAIELYRNRSRISDGFEEERWHAGYQATKLASHESVFKAVFEFVKVFSERPSRIEPLYHAVKSCREREDYMMGYLLGHQQNLKDRTNDVLFVENDIYDWGFYFEYGICAFYVGNFHEFTLNMQEVLRSNAPEAIKEQAKKNLTFLPKTIDTPFTSDVELKSLETTNLSTPGSDCR